MTIEQDCSAETCHQRFESVFDRLVIGAVRLLDALLQLPPIDRSAPEMPVLGCPSRHDTQAATRPRAGAQMPRAFDDGGIDLVL